MTTRASLLRSCLSALVLLAGIGLLPHAIPEAEANRRASPTKTKERKAKKRADRKAARLDTLAVMAKNGWLDGGAPTLGMETAYLNGPGGDGHGTNDMSLIKPLPVPAGYDRYWSQLAKT